MNNEIRWHRDRKVSDELMEKVEKYFNVKFPKTYKEIIKDHDGGDPRIKNSKENGRRHF
ncbi:SMI1/KNR4 family protein [Clostridium sp. JS66]|uniref:SMI1/KNR4 family protein n=1 Tax=Clostridium sp. JS66 TaxID=3064705 RepID=UPI00298EA83F|nr:SMI1/KNR4 family protein [Clostridium sp. JS66]WPC42639.1 SMI1/KNR4 family protein [Clostridium sp. JS66]